MSDFVELPPLPATRNRRMRIIIPSFPRFNIYSRVAKHTTALGPVMIATVVNHIPGWDAEVIDENNYSKHGPHDENGYPDHSLLQELRPADLIGIYGGLTSTAPRIYELAHMYKTMGIPILVGGQHFVGENIREALEHKVDYVIIGEGENTIRELIGALESQKDPATVPGIAFDSHGQTVETEPRPEIDNLSQLPLPDFSLLRLADIMLYPVSWARGCCMHCEFCTVKGRVRCPVPEYVYDQIISLFERMKAKNFFIVDDLFGQHRKDTLVLCRELAKYQERVGVSFFITVQIRLDRARDEELLTAMRRANIRVVAIGYESPIGEELLAMNKKLHPEEMIELTRLYHQAGLMVHGMFIFGYPHQPGSNFTMPVKERIRIFRKFIHDARLDTIQILLPVPLPGTELTRRLADTGRIFSRQEIGWEYYDGNFPLFIPDPPMTADDLRYAQKSLMGGFYKFGYMFYIGVNILMFPAIVCGTFNIRKGWNRWYKSFRNNIWRFIGWIILLKWSSPHTQEEFKARLERAKQRPPQRSHQ